METEKSSPFEKGEISYQKHEGQPQIMVSLEINEKLSIGFPYISLSQVSFQDAESNQFLALQFGETQYVVAGTGLREIYGHLLKQTVSAIKAAPSATRGPKVIEIGLTTGEEESKGVGSQL